MQLTSKQGINQSSHTESNESVNAQSHFSLSIVLFAITTILLFADQNLLAPNLTAIATEFQFTDEERDRKLGGDLAFAFFLLGAPASLVIGTLGDIYSRTTLFVLMIYIGEGACGATYWVKTYRELYICRALTGISMGGAIPLIYSLLGDMYPADQRNGASAIVSMGTGIGIGLGQGIAGYLGPTFGWRLPFLVVAIPALMTATLIAIFVTDPERGKKERIEMEDEISGAVEFHGNDELAMADMGVYTTIDHAKSEKSFFHPYLINNSASNSWNNFERWKYLIQKCFNGLKYTFQTTCLLLRSKSFFLLLIQGMPGCLPWGIVNSFLTDYLAQEQGMSVEGATTLNMLFGFGVFAGIAVGGALGNHLYSLSPAYPPLLAGSSSILGCIPFWIMLNTVTSSSNFVSIFIISTSAGFLAGVAGPIVKGTVMNVTDPCHRGQAFALTAIFDDVGRGLGPFIISRIISLFDGNRKKALNLGVSAWVLCGFLNLMVYFTVIEDENKVNLRLNAIQINNDNVT